MHDTCVTTENLCKLNNLTEQRGSYKRYHADSERTQGTKLVDRERNSRTNYRTSDKLYDMLQVGGRGIYMFSATMVIYIPIPYIELPQSVKVALVVNPLRSISSGNVTDVILLSNTHAKYEKISTSSIHGRSFFRFSSSFFPSP